MFRIFGSENHIQGDIFYIPEKDKFHLGRVVRLKEGDNFEAVIGDTLYELVYINYDKARVVSYVRFKEEELVRVKLFFSILKGDKNDLILQKCTEIGVTDFYPMNTLRSIPDIEGKEDKKLARWQKIVEAASKQSKSRIIPTIHYPINIGHIGQYISANELTIVPYEMEEKISIKRALASYRKGQDINIVIGAEGGFEQIEIISLIKEGATPVSLGPKILRAETAAIVATANVFYELEL